MPGSKKYTRPVSKAQAKLFGAAAGGQIPGFNPAEARKKLEGVNEKKLPARAPKKQR